VKLENKFIFLSPSPYFSMRSFICLRVTLMSTLKDKLKLNFKVLMRSLHKVHKISP